MLAGVKVWKLVHWYIGQALGRKLVYWYIGHVPTFGHVPTRFGTCSCTGTVSTSLSWVRRNEGTVFRAPDPLVPEDRAGQALHLLRQRLHLLLSQLVGDSLEVIKNDLLPDALVWHIDKLPLMEHLHQILVQLPGLRGGGDQEDP